MGERAFEGFVLRPNFRTKHLISCISILIEKSNRVTIFFFIDYFAPILFKNFKNGHPIFPKFLNNPFSSAVNYVRLKRVKRVNSVTTKINKVEF
ncbi:hypothetical protein BpHYR1_038314 [Brachionus plicatilis]|uniref:Uncharacterized protein n=1 Tax=Brachionus plicatilis TaxID=10195 RepID=A0A3M7RZ04_BRAPC|nr:hypothetical protein BpHYR1_038314 [Brachionus plicatilis]